MKLHVKPGKKNDDLCQCSAQATELSTHLVAGHVVIS